MLSENSKTIAFFDAEFTSKSEGSNRGEQELIQYAILIYGVTEKQNKIILSNDSVFETSSFVKPTINPVLSKYIKRLTKIKQEDVDNGKTLEDTICELHRIVSMHKVSDIYVWGPDRLILKTNLLITKKDNDKSRFICGKFSDLSRNVSRKLGYDRPIAQKMASEKLGLPEIGAQHNAYYDAFNLMQIYKEIFCYSK